MLNWQTPFRLVVVLIACSCSVDDDVLVSAQLPQLPRNISGSYSPPATQGGFAAFPNIPGFETSSASTGWQSGKTLIECNQYMLENQVNADINIEVGPENGVTTRLKAHIYMLSSRSSVLDKQVIETQARTADAGEDLTLRVVDVELGVFREILNFIYTEKVSTDNPRVLFPLMAAAKKYQLLRLVQHCQRTLQTGLTVDNACYILDQSLSYSERELGNKSLEFISSNRTSAILRTQGCLNISKGGLREIVSYERLSCSEAELYDASINWARYQIQGSSPNGYMSPSDQSIRTQLDGILQKIRFPLMNITEFAAVSERTSILTCAEKASVYYYIATGDTKQQALTFEWRKRNSMYPGERIVDRFTATIDSMWGCNGGVYSISNKESILFTTDRDILLTAVGSYAKPSPLMHGTRPQMILNLNVEVAQDRSNSPSPINSIPGLYYGNPNDYISMLLGGYGAQTILSTGQLTINSTTNIVNGEIVRIPLNSPITIKAGTYYAVSLAQRSSGLCYYIENYGTTNVEQLMNGDGVRFAFRSPSNSQTTTMRGQIPRLFYVAI